MYTERTTYEPFGRLSGPRTCPAGSGASIDDWVFSFSTSGSTTSSSLSIQIAAGLAPTYVRIRTCRIIRDPNNSRSWNFDQIIRDLWKKYLFLESRIISTNTVTRKRRRRRRRRWWWRRRRRRRRWWWRRRRKRWWRWTPLFWTW